MEYAYKPTTHGRSAMAAYMALGTKPFNITRVAFGSGKVDENTNLADIHELLEYVSEGAVTDRSHLDDRLYITIQYANRQHPEVKTFLLSEFIVYVEDPETGEETDLFYGTLGDYRQPVPAYNPAYPPSVFNFPLELVLSDELQVNISAPIGLATWDDLGRVAGSLAAVQLDITIPAEGWAQKGTDKYPYVLDILVDKATEAMIPSLTILEEGEDTAIACGLAPRVESIKGAVRVFALSAPEQPIPASLTLQGSASGLILPNGESGTTDHRQLSNRDAEAQHPIGAISGLEAELERIPEPVEALTNTKLEEMLK